MLKDCSYKVRIRDAENVWVAREEVFSSLSIRVTFTKHLDKSANPPQRICECVCEAPSSSSQGATYLSETDRKVPQLGSWRRLSRRNPWTYGCCYTGTCYCAQKSPVGPVTFLMTAWSDMKCYIGNPRHPFFAAILKLSCSAAWHRLRGELKASANLP